MMVMLAAVMLVSYSMIALRRLSGNDWTFWSTDLLPYYLARNSFSESWSGFGSVGQIALLTVVVIGARNQFPHRHRLRDARAAVSTAPTIPTGVDRRHRGFQISTVFLMDILFGESLLLFPVLRVDGDLMLGWFDTLRTRFSKDKPKQAEICVVGADSVVGSLEVPMYGSNEQERPKIRAEGTFDPPCERDRGVQNYS